MSRIYVIYVDEQPKFYSYFAIFAKSMDLSRENSTDRTVSKPESWIKNHQQVILLQSTAENEADQSKLAFQKQQVTRAKIYSLFGMHLPVRVQDFRSDVIFGNGQRTVIVQYGATKEPAYAVR